MSEVADLSSLTRAQLEAAVRQLDEERNVMTAANNELLRRIAALPSCADEVVSVLNEWSTICNEVAHASADELRRIVTTRPEKTN